ncbi:hypothetical protein BDFB_012972 [Asbolus verrucosus]|uniref:Pre-C2HC domain-containing protein n=1 Tax=Asbolus verrucosus TaxID=1661398 RepID=A0A482VJT0_ASBVE|nr:hypothetical protein BDFB_012972 [Asbolus verrucosus]
METDNEMETTSENENVTDKEMQMAQEDTVNKNKRINEEEFKIPKKMAKKRQYTQLNIQYTSKNKFEILNDQNNTGESTSNCDKVSNEDTKNTTPIILRNKEKWPTVSKLIDNKNIKITRATNTKEGIRIQPNTEGDYRKLHDELMSQKHEFHTHQLKTEKTLKVVVKGIPVEVPEKDVHDDLLEQGYMTIKITRMNRKGNTPADMVLVELKQEIGNQTQAEASRY